MEGVKNFCNIDNEDFIGMYGGEVIPVKKGKVKPLTETIADHIAGQFASKILMRKEGVNYLDSPERTELLKKILGEVVAKADDEEEEEEVEVEKEEEEEEEEEEFEGLEKEKTDKEVEKEEEEEEKKEEKPKTKKRKTKK